jgi:hypothetical protein
MRRGLRLHSTSGPKPSFSITPGASRKNSVDTGTRQFHATTTRNTRTEGFNQDISTLSQLSNHVNTLGLFQIHHNGPFAPASEIFQEL